jgi:hypothetical protein
MIIASTHMDKDGERHTLESLRILNNTINHYYLPSNFDHNNRAPIGRIYSAKIIELENDEFGVFAEGEVFENSDTLENIQNLNKTVQPHEEVDRIKIIPDPRFLSEDELTFLDELSLRFDNANTRQINKATDYQSVLLVSLGVFLLGNIATGFLQKLGSDAYDYLKAKLIEYYKLKLKKETLEFSILVKDPNTGDIVELNIAINNPKEKDIELFFNTLYKRLDEILNQLEHFIPDAHTIYLNANNQKLEIDFILDKHAIPIKPRLG